MSSPRDDTFYSSYTKARRSPLGAENQNSGLFIGQGGRPALPPISSAFPTSRSPAPSYPPQRASPGRNEFNVNPYSHQWPSNTSSQQHPFSFACYEPHDQLYGSSQYPAARTSPNPPDNVYDFRRLPPMSMSSTARREEGWPTSPFIAHMPFSDEIRSPTTYHAPHYASHHMPHQVPYPFTAMPPDDRNAPFPAAPYNQPPQMYMGPQSSPAGRVGVSRHVVVRRHTHMPAPAEEPVIKKKRKRANAAQLQVLNETYQRTAFPSTEERQTLAVELDMPPRSVQIWFRNKRRSDRQRSRQPPATATTSVVPDDAQVSPSSYGISSMSPTNTGPMHLSHSTRDYSQHRAQSREESGDPRKLSGRRY